MKLIFFVLFFSLYLFSSNITHIKIHNAISPGTSLYLENALIESKKQKSSLLLIELDTPGGLASSMRDMIKNILKSSIPIVMFVSPKGSRAASAGTYLMYASHIAAMTPGSNIGSATPVNLMPKTPSPMNKDKKDKKQNNEKTTMEKKVINDAIAYIKSIAEFKNRNIEWAISAVEKAKNISSEEALELNVIDYMADDINDLLNKIHNKKILVNNKTITINTKDINIIFFPPSLKTQFLIAISNPNIAYMFLMIALYGIFFEMMNPGSIFPGVIGATSAFLAMYALNILPFSVMALLLIILGVIFMLSEVFISGFGILGFAGIISFSTGSFLLFDEKTLGQTLSFPLILAFSFTSLFFFIFLMIYLLKIRKRKTNIGLSTLIGLDVEIISFNKDEYKVYCNGEIWTAKSKNKLDIKKIAEVKSVKDLILTIRRKK